MMKQILSVLLLALSAQNVLGFTGPNSPIRNTPLAQEATDLASKHIASAAGFVTGAVGVIGQVVAADEYELAELPPPYVPAIFGLVLLVGVGVLTSSLGNVMDEGEYRWGVFFCVVYIVQARAQPCIFVSISLCLQRPVWECRVELVRKKKSNEVDRPTLESDRNKFDCFWVGVVGTGY